MKKLLLLSMLSLTFASVSFAGLQEDIDALFGYILSSVDDSKFYEVNQLLIPYKRNPAGMKAILSATKVVAGIANTTPLHIAARNNNAGITANLFTKASVVPNYPVFSHELGNALDGDNKKAINYASTPEIYNFLTTFTDQPY